MCGRDGVHHSADPRQRPVQQGGGLGVPAHQASRQEVANGGIAGLAGWQPVVSSMRVATTVGQNVVHHETMRA